MASPLRHPITLLCVLWMVTSGLGTGPVVDVPETSIRQARCEAFCRNKFPGLTKIRSRNQNGVVSADGCNNNNQCQQCLVPCRDHSSLTTENCTTTCLGVDACLQSCQFLADLQNTSLVTENDVSKSISKPEIVCKNVPYNKVNACTKKAASIYIKWEVLEEIGDDVTMYVISSRHRMNSADNGSDWDVHKIVTNTFLEMDGLACDTYYQFAVTMVTENGRRSSSETTVWSKTLKVFRGQTPSPPISMTVEDVIVEDQRPSVFITWDVNEDASCYYRIFWMSTHMEEREIKTPREFKYKIKHLEFSTNYSVLLYAYDDQFRRSSKEVQQNVLTPDCLSSTLYNYSVCGPLPPDNLTLEVMTRNYDDASVKYVNVTLFWGPPPRTHKGLDIRRYYVEYRKEPLIRGAYLLEPDRGSLLINSSDTFVRIDRIHNHNHYSFSVIANTRGGNSTALKLVQYIGLEGGRSFTGSATISDSHVPISNELVVIVLSCAVLIIIPLVIVFVVLLKRRHHHRGNKAHRRFGPVEETNPIYDRVNGVEFQHKLIPDDYEIDYSRLDFISVIGEGAFGKVVKADYRPPSDNGENKPPQVVAVKMLKGLEYLTTKDLYRNPTLYEIIKIEVINEFYTGDESRNFLLEIQAMKNLGHHPYIVSIIGSCMTGPKLCLIMDYCALGDLRNYLRKYREKMLYTITSPYGMMSKPEESDIEVPLLHQTGTTSPYSLDTNKSNLSINGEAQIELTEGQLLSYARQITMGMEFLEERKFIHRDLATRNILLCDPRHLKISDFGLTRDVYETNVYQPTSARKLPYKWMAIESLFSQRFTIKSDVWSFGIVLWEIVTLGGSPYPSIPLKDLYGLLKDGYRMEKPDNCSPKLYAIAPHVTTKFRMHYNRFQIMLACWHPNPNCRPAFSQLRVRLEKLLEQTQSYIDLSIEVSNDYFNESTSGSHPPPYPNCNEETRMSSVDSTGTPSEVSHLASSKDLYIDVHEGENGAEAETDTPDAAQEATNDKESENDVFSNTLSESNIFPVACENCSFHMENSNQHSSNGAAGENDSSKRCQCVLCVNKASMDDRTPKVWENQSKMRGSVKCSWRNLIDKVSAKASDNISRQKKRSVSLTDVYNLEWRRESQV